MDCRLYYIIPLRNGIHRIPPTDRYNMTATVLRYTITKKRVAVVLFEGGLLKAYIKKKPRLVKVNGEIVDEWEFDRQALIFNAPFLNNQHPEIEIFF